MSDDLVERIKADREAGTPGVFEASEVGDYSDYGGGCVVVLGDDRRRFIVLGSSAEAEADARRIESIPDMEARILADAEALKAADALARELQRQAENMADSFGVEDWTEVAPHSADLVAAYRKARGGSE